MPSQLFTPIKLRGLELSNRIIVSPMCQYSAIDGAMRNKAGMWGGECMAPWEWRRQ